MKKPCTSCGCFEAIVFYIPDVDGFGVVHRHFKGETPYGLPFSAIAGQCSGGKQVEGFVGIAIEYMRSPKFLKGDGGWNKIVWLPEELKDKINDAIPEGLRDKIATEIEKLEVDKDIAETNIKPNQNVFQYTLEENSVYIVKSNPIPTQDYPTTKVLIVLQKPTRENGHFKYYKLKKDKKNVFWKKLIGADKKIFIDICNFYVVVAWGWGVVLLQIESSFDN